MECFFVIFFCFFVFLLFLTIVWMTGFMTDGHSFYVGRLNPFQVCDIYRRDADECVMLRMMHSRGCLRPISILSAGWQDRG